MLRRILDTLKDTVAGGIGASLESLESNGLRATCHTAWPTDADMIGQWDALSRSEISGTAFLSPVWQQAVMATMYPTARIRFITVHQGSTLLAALPLVLEPNGTLQTPGAPVCDYLDPLIADEPRMECWRIILSLVHRMWDRRIHALCFHNVRESGASRALLAELSPEMGFEFQEEIVEQCPFLKLPGTWEDFLAGMEGHERREFRRRLTKAETKGNARFTRCESEADIASALETSIALMEAAPGEKGLAVKNTLRPLLLRGGPEMIRLRRLDLLTLKVNDEPIACLLQFPHPTGPLFYNCGFDPAKREWSPGNVMLAMAIREAIGKGFGEFDMLRGTEAYKYSLGAKDRPLYKITLRKR